MKTMKTMNILNFEFSLSFINPNGFLRGFAFGLDDNFCLDPLLFLGHNNSYYPLWFIALVVACSLGLLGLLTILGPLGLRAEPATTSITSSSQPHVSSLKITDQSKDSNPGVVNIVWGMVNRGTQIQNVNTGQIKTVTNNGGAFFYNVRGIRGENFLGLPCSANAVRTVVRINGVWTTGYFFAGPRDVGFTLKRLGIKHHKFLEISAANTVTSLNIPIQPDARGDLHIRFSGHTVQTGLPE